VNAHRKLALLEDRRRGGLGQRRSPALVEPLEGRLLLSSVTITPQDVLTYHTSGNPTTTSAGSSTGYDGSETVLTTGDVNPTDFGKQFTTTLDGQIYAQPLAVANVDITTGANAGIHNVIFVATMHDSLYAIDANTGTILWQDNFTQIGNPQVSGSVNSTAGVTTVPGNSTENAMISSDIGPELGIVATPVINPATNTIYLIAITQERRNGSTPNASGSDWHFVQRLWAISMSDGSVAITPSNPAVEPASDGQVIGDTILDPTSGNTYPTFTNYSGYEYVAGPYIKGTGDNGGSQPTDDGWKVNPNDTTSVFAGTTPTALTDVAFNAVLQMSRTGLSLINGVLYFGFASHGDDGPYYGWILGYNASTLANTIAFVTTPTYESFGVVSGDRSQFDAQGGVWMSGGLIVTDGTYLYLTTGNGAFNYSTSNFSSNYYSMDGTNKVLLPLDGDYGDAILKLAIDPSANQNSLNVKSPPTTYTPDGQNLNGYGLKVVDFFVPSNVLYLNFADEDLGSGGVTLLPPSITSTVPGHVGDPMLITGGKEGRIYLIDQDNLGGYNTSYPSTFSGSNPAVGPDPSTYDRVLGEYSVNGVDNGSNDYYDTASYFPNGSSPEFFVNLGGRPDWQFNVSSFQASQSPPGSASANTPAASTSNSFGSRATTNTISANGSSNALVWALNVGPSSTDDLLAYTTSLGTAIYDTNTDSSRDSLAGGVSGATGVKFNVPTVFNGMVYVGTGGGSGTGGHILGTLVGYGLLDSYLTSNASYFGAPSALAAKWVAGPTAGVQLNWTRNSTLETEIEVDRSTDGMHWSVLTYLTNGTTAYLDTSATESGTYYYRVRAISGANATAYSNTAEDTTTVANEYLFYYGSSAFDGGATSPSSADQNAIAENSDGTDKTALLPNGTTATFANISNYSDGINGILIDFAGISGVTFSAGDFQFNVGNNDTPSSWAGGPVPTAVATWTGNDGDTFADIVWANNAIQEQWLQVTVLADANTHLASNSVFYFGNEIGATGASTAMTPNGEVLRVTASDVVATQNNVSLLQSVPISDVYDYNRDGKVTAADIVLCQNNTTLLGGLELISVGTSGGALVGRGAPKSPHAVSAANHNPAAVFADSPIQDAGTSSLLQENGDVLDRASLHLVNIAHG